MNYRLWQIDVDRSIYEMTYEGQCPEEGKTIPEILEELFLRFNRTYLLPAEHRRRGISHDRVGAVQQQCLCKSRCNER